MFKQVSVALEITTTEEYLDRVDCAGCNILWNRSSENMFHFTGTQLFQKIIQANNKEAIKGVCCWLFVLGIHDWKYKFT